VQQHSLLARGPQLILAREQSNRIALSILPRKVWDALCDLEDSARMQAQVDENHATYATQRRRMRRIFLSCSVA